MMFMVDSLLGLVSRTRCSAKRCAAEPGSIHWQRGSRFCSASQVPRSARDTKLHSRRVELRLLAGTIAAQRAFLADRVGALEYPVLPRGEAREDFRFHGLGSDEAQIGFHAGEAIGRERGALLEEHPDLVIPIAIVERKGDKAERLGLLGIERLADPLLGALQIGRFGLKTRLQPRQPMAHRIGTEIQRREFDRRGPAVVALPR